MNVARLNMSHGDETSHARTVAAIREAAARRGATVAIMVDTRGREIRTGEVENGLTNETLLREREAFLEEAVQENREAVELAQAKFDGGEIDLLSVLQLQRRLINARVALIDVQSRRLTQRVNLHLSLGGNFELEEEGTPAS